MVPDLGCIVVNATAGLLDDFFQRQAFKLGAFLQVVQVDHISVVVLAMVELQCFLAVVGGQSVNRIRQGWQGMFHE